MAHPIFKPLLGGISSETTEIIAMLKSCAFPKKVDSNIAI
jgi:hypothetical protein